MKNFDFWGALLVVLCGIVPAVLFAACSVSAGIAGDVCGAVGGLLVAVTLLMFPTMYVFDGLKR